MFDLDLSARQISSLTTLDAMSQFFNGLGYRTGARQPLSPEAIGLAGEAVTPKPPWLARSSSKPLSVSTRTR